MTQSSLFFNQSSRFGRKLWVSLFFIVYLAVGINSFNDFGVSWDEPVSRNNGMVSLKYVGNLIASDLITGDKTLQRYPPLDKYYDKDYGVAFELPLAFFERLLSINDSRDIYFFRHLITFLFSFAGVFAVYKLAERRFEDWRLGLLGAAVLVFSPRLFAESFYNDKDVVFMALFAIGLNTTVLFLRNPTYRMAFWHALATAILIDVRIMGILLPVATIFMLILRLFKREIGLQSSLLALLSYLLLSVILTISFWPYLWADPWVNFIQAFENMSKFRWVYSVLYLGQTIDATALPWHYIPVWLGITTPIAYLLAFIIGVVAVVRTVITCQWRLWDNEAGWQDLLFLGFVASPVMSVILLNSVLYDGWRQLYFIYPAFILLALRGWQSLFFFRPAKHALAWQTSVILATFISLLSIGYWMKMAHPFQNVYFNALAGKQVKTKFEVDYWGLSSRQALQYIADNSTTVPLFVWAGSFLPLEQGKLLLEPSVRHRIKVVSGQAQADYIVTQYRHNLTDYSKIGIPFDLFYEISVDGESILSVYKRVSGSLNED